MSPALREYLKRELIYLYYRGRKERRHTWGYIEIHLDNYTPLFPCELQTLELYNFP